MATYIFQKIAQAAQALGITSQNLENAQKWFRTQAIRMKNVDVNQMLASDPDRFVRSSVVGKDNIGRMIMFFYDPLHKADLPYYDRFPVIFAVEPTSDSKNGKGFLGINLHYLSPFQRAKLMDALYKENQRPKSASYKLNVSYQILKGASGMRSYKPCLKRYLYKHVRSRFFVVRPEEWDVIALLPTERFEKGGKGNNGKWGGAYSKQRVWQDSMRKV